MARPLAYLLSTSLVGALALGIWNYVALQRDAWAVLKGDPRNAGIELFAHYQWFVNPSTVVFDLRHVPGDKSALDVSRTLLQFAERKKGDRVELVILAYKGQPRFLLKGEYFNTLGVEYEVQNPVYTLRTLPENVYNLDGSAAFGTWTGGMLGVLGKQMEDLTEFHARWYMSAAASGS